MEIGGERSLGVARGRFGGVPGAAIVWSDGSIAGLGEEGENVAVLMGCGRESVYKENGAFGFGMRGASCIVDTHFGI